jgi:hypothetical protein
VDSVGMSHEEMVTRVAKRAAVKSPKQVADELFRLTEETFTMGNTAASMVLDKPAQIEMSRLVLQAHRVLWEVQRSFREHLKNGQVGEYDRRMAAQDPDPTKPLESNAVAYFTVGGDEDEGDPESISLSKGHVPVQEVIKYLHKREPSAKAQPGQHPGEIQVHAIDWQKKPYSYVTKVKVKSRK